MRNVGKEKIEKKNGEKEGSAAQSSVSLSLEKEAEEPPPLSFCVSWI